MTLYTIGFTRKTAEEFFTLLRRAGVKRIIDIRLSNRSQLAAFAKKEDLRYFLKAICGIDYLHLPSLAPTQEMLDAYKKRKGRWEDFEREFFLVAAARHIERELPHETLDSACLLCSEPVADRCHRRLVAEYLRKKHDDITVCHL
jgi:uncharacterized protein (DUF488 family)